VIGAIASGRGLSATPEEIGSELTFFTFELFDITRDQRIRKNSFGGRLLQAIASARRIVGTGITERIAVGSLTINKSDAAAS
jgi:hypothetical protein